MPGAGSRMTKEWSGRSERSESQSCPTLWDPMDYTVHGILQTRMLEWVAFPFSRGSLNPGIKPRSPTLWVDSLPTEPQGKPSSHEVCDNFSQKQQETTYMYGPVLLYSLDQLTFCTWKQLLEEDFCYGFWVLVVAQPRPPAHSVYYHDESTSNEM